MKSRSSSRKKKSSGLIYIVVVVLIVLLIAFATWFFSGQKTPQKAARKFVEAWANYDLSGMKSVSTKEMSEGMVDAYFLSFLNSLENMRRITADAEGIPVASVEYPVKWDSWKLSYTVVDDGVVEVKGTVGYIYKAYEETTTLSRSIHWIVTTTKEGNNYLVSGVKIIADNPMEAVWTFMDALMSRNMFYVKKAVASEPDEGLANFLASMGLEFSRGYATKGLFLLPAVYDEGDANRVHVSYTRVGIGGTSSLISDVAIVDATFDTVREGDGYVVKNVFFKEIGEW